MRSGSIRLPAQNISLRRHKGKCGSTCQRGLLSAGRPAQKKPFEWIHFVHKCEKGTIDFTCNPYSQSRLWFWLISFCFVILVTGGGRCAASVVQSFNVNTFYFWRKKSSLKCNIFNIFINKTCLSKSNVFIDIYVGVKGIW